MFAVENAKQMFFAWAMFWMHND